MKKSIKIVSIFLALCQFSLCNFFCSTEDQIKQIITGVEKEYISKGSFGKIYGNNDEVSKTMYTNELISLQLLNNELKVMLAYRKEHDMMQLNKNNCWYNKEQGKNKYEVKIKMDRMQGNLKDSIQKSSYRQSVFWKLDMLFKISTALKKMHDYKILHLDLKELNIMMMNDFTPILADFGMAKLPGESRNFIGGTPMFMSPEINMGQYSEKADIFALGIIFFQILNARFVQNQVFRKLCNYRELYYDKLYCQFDKMINSMLNYSPSLRPTIDQVIQKITLKISQYYQVYAKEFSRYLLEEQQSFLSNTAPFAIKKRTQQLINKLQERRNIYSQVFDASFESQQNLQLLIKQYCTLQKDPKKFLNKYSQQYAIVGPSPQEVQQMDQTFYQQELEKSKINFQKRMEFAEQSRIKLLDQKYIFQQQAVEETSLDLPAIKIKQRAVSNNLNGQMKFQKQQRLPNLDLGIDQRVVQKLNLSPSKQRNEHKLPFINYKPNFQQPNYPLQNKQQLNYNLPNIQQPKQQFQYAQQPKQQFQYAQQLNMNLPNIHQPNHQFQNPQQHLFVNKNNQQQSPITRPGFEQYQMYKKRQHVDNVAQLLGGGQFQGGNFNQQFAGRFII